MTVNQGQNRGSNILIWDGNTSGPPLKDQSRREHNSWVLKQEPKKVAEEVLVASCKPNPTQLELFNIHSTSQAVYIS